MNPGVSATLAAPLGGRRCMAWTDLAILAIIGVSAVLSLFRGFVRESISLAGWVAGLWMAFNYMRVGAEYFVRWVETPELRLVLGFVVILAVVLVIASVVGRVAGGLVNATGLGATDRVLGMIFGAGRGAIIVACLILVAGFANLNAHPWWDESTLIPAFETLAAEVSRILPAEFAERLLW